MIVAALLLLAQTASAEPIDDIIVVARQLRTVRLAYDVDRGAVRTCRVKDAVTPTTRRIACDAVGQCAAENPVTGDRHLAPCIRDRVRSLFAAYRAQPQASPKAQ